MLKGVPKELSPELLGLLAEMGHGDEIVVVDANYPAYSAGPPVVAVPGVDAPTMVAAILKLMPLDTFVEENVFLMDSGNEEKPEIWQDFHQVLKESGEDARTAPIDRFDFYERAQNAYAIVATGEGRPYGCVILKKGVIFF